MASVNYWTFGTKCCGVRLVGTISWNVNRTRGEDKTGRVYAEERLFDTKKKALLAAMRYLDRKQAEADKIQNSIDIRRILVRQQLSCCT